MTKKLKTKIRKNIWEIFFIVFDYLPKRRRRQFGILLVAMIGLAILETMSLCVIATFASALTDPMNIMDSKYLILMRENFSWFVLKESAHVIIFLGIIVIIIIPLKNFAQGFIVYWISLYSARIESFFGEKILNGFLSKNYEWFLDKNTADLILAIQWRDFLGTRFLNPFLNLFSDAVIVVFMLGALFIVQPIISAIVLFVVGSMAYLIYFKMKVYIDLFAQKRTDLLQEVNRNCTKAIHGAKDVKILCKKEVFVSEFLRDTLQLADYTAPLSCLQKAPTLILESVGFAMLTSVVCVMLFYLDSSLASVTGTMALLAVTSWRVLPAINRIVNYCTVLRNALPYILIQLDYLNQIESDVFEDDPRQGNPTINFTKSIEFKNIVFKYKGSDKLIINKVSFSIQKGKTVGIIGFSGSGKSTITELIIGLLNPSKGSLAIDGKNLEKSDLIAWRRKIGHVSQAPYIFDGTLAENIAFGEPENVINRNKVLECCKMAAMDFLEDLKSGIDSQIGERGVCLSGGQQQRVAIARALYRNPEVLVFDEATSSLDHKSEKAILKTIYSFKGKLTMVIISHRLSTVEKCDLIFWLEKGELRDSDEPKKIIDKYKNEIRPVMSD